MTGLPYILDLFQGILDTSKAIEGRFHVAYRYGGQEINSDQMGEVLKDIQLPDKKYPLAALIPPNSTGYINEKESSWLRYRIILCFMKTTFYDGNNEISLPNPKTKTSMHTVPDDLHDMMRCAVNFIKRLDLIQRKSKVLFRFPKNLVLFTPMSTIGVDRATGIKAHFDLDVFLSCNTEDYDEYDTDLVISPDSHPEHHPL